MPRQLALVVSAPRKPGRPCRRTTSSKRFALPLYPDSSSAVAAEVLNVSEASKEWVANPQNWNCDAPGWESYETPKSQVFRTSAEALKKDVRHQSEQSCVTVGICTSSLWLKLLGAGHWHCRGQYPPSIRHILSQQKASPEESQCF